MQNEENAYILGTEQAELHRLGLQHQIWASEAQQGWQNAGFTAGQTILDLGCGPGFCTKEMAYIVGNTGKVIGIDRSKAYIDFLNQTGKLHNLPMQGIAADFDDMQLEPNSLDGVYSRWALAWVANPNEVLAKVYKALKPGGKLVTHEYVEWRTHSIEPHKPHITKAIQAALLSFKEQPGDIDVGRFIPKMVSDLGMKVSSTRPMAKIARPNELTWHWPKSFYEVYFPKLVEMNYLTKEELDAAFDDFYELEKNPETMLVCPMLVEVIAMK